MKDSQVERGAQASSRAEGPESRGPSPVPAAQAPLPFPVGPAARRETALRSPQREAELPPTKPGTELERGNATPRKHSRKRKQRRPATTEPPRSYASYPSGGAGAPVTAAQAAARPPNSSPGASPKASRRIQWSRCKGQLGAWPTWEGLSADGQRRYRAERDGGGWSVAWAWIGAQAAALEPALASNGKVSGRFQEIRDAKAACQRNENRALALDDLAAGLRRELGDLSAVFEGMPTVGALCGCGAMYRSRCAIIRVVGKVCERCAIMHRVSELACPLCLSARPVEVLP